MFGLTFQLGFDEPMEHIWCGDFCGPLSSWYSYWSHISDSRTWSNILGCFRQQVLEVATHESNWDCSDGYNPLSPWNNLKR